MKKLLFITLLIVGINSHGLSLGWLLPGPTPSQNNHTAYYETEINSKGKECYRDSKDFNKLIRSTQKDLALKAPLYAATGAAIATGSIVYLVHLLKKRPHNNKYKKLLALFICCTAAGGFIQSSLSLFRWYIYSHPHCLFLRNDYERCAYHANNPHQVVRASYSLNQRIVEYENQQIRKCTQLPLPIINGSSSIEFPK
jgi:hypothetical protein